MSHQANYILQAFAKVLHYNPNVVCIRHYGIKLSRVLVT